MQKTPLHALHIAQGAKMGEFAGYDMPLYYTDGVVKEHDWVRTQAGVFDVSHMGQIEVAGAGATKFLERLTPSSFENLPLGRAKYTVLTNPRGGIIDDLIITRVAAERYFAVINAGCKDKDIAWISEQLHGDVGLHRLHDRALIALQGPLAEAMLREVLGIDTAGQPYMWMEYAHLTDGTEVFVSRLGYTGEDGFELSVPDSKAPGVWEALCAHRAVRPIGLAARDSLRLDMGYCLYGHDIDEETTPVEAGLGWVFGRDNTGFIGAEIVRGQVSGGAPRQRVGIRLLDKGIAREGATLLNADGRTVGKITSGAFSPTLKTAVAQGYVETASATPGTKLQADVRGRLIAAECCTLPFVPAKTKSMKKQAA